MPDIFISYSRKDSTQAQRLAEMLASAGLSCWIDKQGIGVATSWSGEIVDAIDGCKVMIVLLSAASIQSTNVVKEVSLASEQKKKILPLDVEPVELSRDLKYHLAGIQRAPMENIDAIIRALGKLGLEATGSAHPPKIEKAPDGRKALMILPFEDLSPTSDNGWFADGIVTELIGALSKVKALKLADSQSTKEFKHYRGHLSTYARETGIRYFVQGDVRKFGDQIKISSRLLDMENGDHLWQDSMKGTMNDIFDIQEKVAEKVVEGLKIYLASDEKEKLSERGTENAEAYELTIKADEYFSAQTKEGTELALKLYSEAIELDPAYAQPYASKANALAYMYRDYDRDPNVLDEGLALVHEALERKPSLWRAYSSLSMLLMNQGKIEESEQAALVLIQNAPEDPTAHVTLGNFYLQTGQFVNAIASLEEAINIKPDALNTLFNLIIACDRAKDIGKQKHWAEIAIPKIEKHLRLFPNDDNKRINRAILLNFAGRDEEAKQEAMKLMSLKGGFQLYQAACLLLDLKEFELALSTCQKAIDAGFRDTNQLKAFLDMEEEGVSPFIGLLQWEPLRKLVENIERESKANS